MTDFVARQDNQAITFTGDDMGGDQVMVQWLLYIVIVILAFIFAITARSTIEQESSVVGTLLASRLYERRIGAALYDAAGGCYAGRICCRKCTRVYMDEICCGRDVLP